MKKYKENFVKNGDNLDGTAGLDKFEDLQKWLEQVRSNSNSFTLIQGFVLSSTYLVRLRENNKLIGMIDIRHNLNDTLLKEGGNIVYSVLPEERNKGYGYRILYEGLKNVKKFDLKKF